MVKESKSGTQLIQREREPRCWTWWIMVLEVSSFRDEGHIGWIFFNKGTNLFLNILFIGPRMVYCSIINLLWSLMSKMSTTFRPVSYGPCSRTGVTCVASDFGGIIWLCMPSTIKLSSCCQHGTSWDLITYYHLIIFFNSCGDIRWYII